MCDNGNSEFYSIKYIKYYLQDFKTLSGNDCYACIFLDI